MDYTQLVLHNILVPALGTTFIILFWAFLFSTLAGIALALVLVLSYPAGLRPCAVVYHVVDTVVNLVRSTPFIILIVTLMPLMRLIFGSAIGIPAAVFAISVHGCTTVARLLEGSFREASPTLIEAAQSLGAPRWRIVKTVIMGETLPSAVTNLTYVAIQLLSCTAVAGVVGAGGVGSVAIAYGYQNFDDTVMYTCLAILVAITIVLQVVGNRIYLKVK